MTLEMSELFFSLVEIVLVSFFILFWCVFLKGNPRVFNKCLLNWGFRVHVACRVAEIKGDKEAWGLCVEMRW